jgi:uncharacterized phage-associated protein
MFESAWRLVHRNPRRYARPMADLSAREVAAEIRRRLPGVGVKKLHKLLYYCQAHHVAAMSKPMFTEPISAWDMGPVVAPLWYRENQGSPDPPRPTASASLGEPELNTIGYVLSRYGKLSGIDLERLTHSEGPWIQADAARRSDGARTAPISLESLRAFFTREREPDPEDGPPVPDEAEVTAWLKGARQRLNDPSSPDTMDRLLTLLR